ncbi:MAG: patatin-like phospholipase family protein [Candidatus Pacebacteria bacterium]|nr:patatin-like phospholipase family protein [Candidatus Paceibacterota bacterium]
MREEKVAIVTSGGGMKCAYAAGALGALTKRLGITEPDIFISASGSVGAMFYYLAKQYDHIEKIWLRYLPSKEVVHRFPPRLELDYIIDDIMRQELPLDEHAFSTTKTRWFVPVTDLDTGRAEFISNNTWFNPYEVMRAAKAIPFLYGGAVRLGSRSFIDGDLNMNMTNLIRKARKEGATKILVITNTIALTSLQKWFLRIYAFFVSPIIRQLALYDLKRTHFDHLPSDVEILVVGPSFPLPAGLFTRNRRAVTESYQMGWDDLLAKRTEIERLFT